MVTVLAVLGVGVIVGLIVAVIMLVWYFRNIM